MAPRAVTEGRARNSKTLTNLMNFNCNAVVRVGASKLPTSRLGDWLRPPLSLEDAYPFSIRYPLPSKKITIQKMTYEKSSCLAVTAFL